MAKTVAEYLANADECMKLAKTVQKQEHKDALLRMAATWERLAKRRQEMLATGEAVDDS